jgi:hypothetical protein
MVGDIRQGGIVQTRSQSCILQNTKCYEVLFIRHLGKHISVLKAVHVLLALVGNVFILIVTN